MHKSWYTVLELRGRIRSSDLGSSEDIIGDGEECLRTLQGMYPSNIPGLSRIFCHNLATQPSSGRNFRLLPDGIHYAPQFCRGPGSTWPAVESKAALFLDFIQTIRSSPGPVFLTEHSEAVAWLLRHGRETAEDNEYQILQKCNEQDVFFSWQNIGAAVVQPWLKKVVDYPPHGDQPWCWYSPEIRELSRRGRKAAETRQANTTRKQEQQAARDALKVKYFDTHPLFEALLGLIRNILRQKFDSLPHYHGGEELFLLLRTFCLLTKPGIYRKLPEFQHLVRKIAANPDPELHTGGLALTYYEWLLEETKRKLPKPLTHEEVYQQSDLKLLTRKIPPHLFPGTTK